MHSPKEEEWVFKDGDFWMWKCISKPRVNIAILKPVLAGQSDIVLQTLESGVKKVLVLWEICVLQTGWEGQHSHKRKGKEWENTLPVGFIDYYRMSMVRALRFAKRRAPQCRPRGQQWKAVAMEDALWQTGSWTRLCLKIKDQSRVGIIGLHYTTRGILKHFSTKKILSGNKIILCWFCVLSKKCQTALLMK